MLKRYVLLLFMLSPLSKVQNLKTEVSPLTNSVLISDFPIYDSFEFGFGHWSQKYQIDDIDWARDSGGTPTSDTGPSTGAMGQWYMYLEASYPNYPGKTAILESPLLDYTQTNEASLSFSYHMFGSVTGVNLQVLISIDAGYSWSGPIWSKSGSQSNNWISEYIDLEAYLGSIAQIRIVGTTGESWRGDIAIDNIIINGNPAACQTGLPCDDGDPCTSGEVYDGYCECNGGTFTDDDGDGVCDLYDQCPGFDDNLIGTGCDDGDPCTSGELYDASCGCSGGTFEDSDGDGVCDLYDQCPGFDDNLIGTGCDDGDPCTSGELYDTSCGCSGGTFEDSDGDGVCDLYDQCPGFDDNLIGMECEDGDDCTTGELYDTSCGCSGGIFTDIDGDGYCIGEDPDDYDPCDPDSTSLFCNPCSIHSHEDFEINYGAWFDGGGDCSRVMLYANSGNISVRLRDNSGFASAMQTDILDLSLIDVVNLSFSYYPVSMEAGEDFFLEISKNAGASYSKYKEWNSGVEFENNQRYFEYVSIDDVVFNAMTRFRLRCDASSNNDLIYIDDVQMEFCDYGKLKQEEEEIGSRSSNEAIKNDDISLYPNPVSDELTVSFIGGVPELNTSQMSYTIYSITGKKCKSGQLGFDSRIRLNVEELDINQSYILKLVIDQDRIIYKRFVKL
jgi:hypothetical protein